MFSEPLLKKLEDAPFSFLFPVWVEGVQDFNQTEKSWREYLEEKKNRFLFRFFRISWSFVKPGKKIKVEEEKIFTRSRASSSLILGVWEWADGLDWTKTTYSGWN